MLAFDFAGLDDVIGQCGQTGLVAQTETNVGKPAEQQALTLTDLCQRRYQRRQLVTPGWPVRGLPDISVIAAVHAVIVGINRCVANACSSNEADGTGRNHDNENHT